MHSIHGDDSNLFHAAPEHTETACTESNIGYLIIQSSKPCIEADQPLAIRIAFGSDMTTRGDISNQYSFHYQRIKGVLPTRTNQTIHSLEPIPKLIRTRTIPFAIPASTDCVHHSKDIGCLAADQVNESCIDDQSRLNAQIGEDTKFEFGSL